MSKRFLQSVKMTRYTEGIGGIDYEQEFIEGYHNTIPRG